MKERFFRVFVALNQLTCSIVFFPVCRTRETICGLVGRYADTDRTWRGGVARRIAPHLEERFHKAETCVDVYRKEEKAREILYG